MATRDPDRRPALMAASHAPDRAIESAVASKPDHPSGTVLFHQMFRRDESSPRRPPGWHGEAVSDGRRNVIAAAFLAALIGRAASRRWPLGQ